MSTAFPSPTRPGWRKAAVAALVASVVLPVAAQYKVVGPDGRVTYTDRPPSDASARVTTMGRDSPAEAAPQDALPPELRQAATRFPVTLYSTADCPPCESARQFLMQRGVPFTEKLVVSEDDVAAMERVLGGRIVPSLTIGTQALRGLSQGDWTVYLDAAGYPRDSRLPKGWQPPAATPLVARSGPRPAAAASAAERAAQPPAPAPLAPAEPTGIRF